MTLAPMDRNEAERITERIRVALDRVSNSWADLGERITEAYQRRADLALGYSSWSAYAEAELKPSTGLAAEVRRQLVGMLSQTGMSTRAIAPTVGVTQKTVVKDTQVIPQVSPPASAERIDPLTGEVLDGDREPSFIDPAPAPESKPITGLDGKTYIKSTPKPESKPPRPALPPQIQSAGWDLAKAVERVQKLANDDRFNTHKSEVAPHLRSHLTGAIEVCQDLLDRINN